MASFETFSVEHEPDTFSGYGSYTGFTSGGGDPTGVFFGEDDVSVDQPAASPYGSVPVVNGNGNEGFFEGDDGVFASDGPMLPSPIEMEPEEGYALREWRR